MGEEEHAKCLWIYLCLDDVCCFLWGSTVLNNRKTNVFRAAAVTAYRIKSACGCGCVYFFFLGG